MPFYWFSERWRELHLGLLRKPLCLILIPNPRLGSVTKDPSLKVVWFTGNHTRTPGSILLFSRLTFKQLATCSRDTWCRSSATRLCSPRGTGACMADTGWCFLVQGPSNRSHTPGRCLLCSFMVVDSLWQLLYEAELLALLTFCSKVSNERQFPIFWAGRVVCTLFCKSSHLPPTWIPERNIFIKCNSLLADVCNTNRSCWSSRNPCWFGWFIYQFSKHDQVFGKLY